MNTGLVFDQKERVGAWVAERVEQSAPWGSFYAMGAERNGELVAGIVLNNYNGVNAFVHIAIEKPGKDTIKLFRAFADYAFRQCKLKRLTGLTPDNLPGVLAFDRKAGWELEFTMRDAAPDGGPLHVVVMRPARCRWFNGGVAA